MEQKRKQIGMVARELGVNPKTIRYYEEIGLLPAPERSDGGYRVYKQGDIDKISFILRARSLDFSLDNIGDILSLSKNGEPPCSYVLDLIGREIATIDSKIEALRKLKEELKDIRNQAGSSPAPKEVDPNCTCRLIENAPAD